MPHAFNWADLQCPDAPRCRVPRFAIHFFAKLDPIGALFFKLADYKAGSIVASKPFR
jgi:hypothetical protein